MADIFSSLTSALAPGGLYYDSSSNRWITDPTKAAPGSITDAMYGGSFYDGTGGVNNAPGVSDLTSALLGIGGSDSGFGSFMNSALPLASLGLQGFGLFEGLDLAKEKLDLTKKSARDAYEANRAKENNRLARAESVSRQLTGNPNYKDPRQRIKASSL